MALPSWARFLPPAAIALVSGAILGYLWAFGVSEGSVGTVGGVIVVVATLGLLVAVAIGVGVVRLARSEAQPRPAAAFGVAGLLLLGGAAGHQSVPLFDMGYHPYVLVEPSVNPTLHATVSLRVEDPSWVAGEGDRPGVCPFDPGGLVRLVSVEEAGRMRFKPMSVDLDLGASAVSGSSGQLALVVNLLAPAAIIPGAEQAATSGGGYISWVGSVVLADVATDGTRGRATIVDLPVTGAGVPGWPTLLSGELSWVCD